MATRSLIGIVNQDGSINYIYCHFDGFPTGEKSVGWTLRDFYVDEEKIRKLINGGDISALVPDVDSVERYERNDGRRAISETEFRMMGKKSCVDYLYLFENNNWFHRKLS